MNNKFIIPFFTAGYPSISSIQDIVLGLDAVQVPYIEIGLPHSDALADGEIIQNSSHKAIENGMNIDVLFEEVQKVSDKLLYSKLILFSYINPLIRCGLQNVISKWKEVGGMGLLIPDLPLEESDEVLEICKQNNIKLIFLIAPTSTPNRIEKIVDISTEFIYLVSVTGVTGIRDEINTNLRAIIQIIKTKKTDMKVVVGFGIKDKLTAKQALIQGADGIVVGSAFIQKLKPENLTEGIDFIKSLLL